ncbi:MAG: YlxR family protein [Candidatus Nanopelagicales bacterium]
MVGTPERSAPVTRTCVGCRERAAQSDLLRVVASGTQVVPDGPVRQAGRGAYMHPRTECLDLAERRRAFPRALRVPGPLATEALAARLQQEMTVRGSGD